MPSERNGVHPSMEGLGSFMQVMGDSRLLPLITCSIDGMIMKPSQLVEAILLRGLSPDFDDDRSLMIGSGTRYLQLMGCIMMRVCHLPTEIDDDGQVTQQGCAPGITSHHPDDLARFKGTPSEIVERDLAFTTEAATTFMRAGIYDLRDLPKGPDLATKVVTRFDVAEIVRKNALAGPLPLKVNSAVLPPPMVITFDVAKDALDQAKQNGGKAQLGAPVDHFFGARFTKLMAERDLTGPVTITAPVDGANQVGTFLPKGVLLKLTGHVGEQAGIGSFGAIHVDGVAGDACGEAAHASSDITVLATGSKCGILAKGGTITTCQIGKRGAEEVRRLHMVLLGNPSEFMATLEPQFRQYFDANLPETYIKFQENTINGPFGMGALGLHTIMPKAAFDSANAKGYLAPDVAAHQAELTDRDVDMLRQKIDAAADTFTTPNHVSGLSRLLKALSIEEGDVFLRQHFCRTGHTFEDFRDESHGKTYSRDHVKADAGVAVAELDMMAVCGQDRLTQAGDKVDPAKHADLAKLGMPFTY